MCLIRCSLMCKWGSDGLLMWCSLPRHSSIPEVDFHSTVNLVYFTEPAYCTSHCDGACFFNRSLLHRKYNLLRSLLFSWGLYGKSEPWRNFIPGNHNSFRNYPDAHLINVTLDSYRTGIFWHNWLKISADFFLIKLFSDFTISENLRYRWKKNSAFNHIHLLNLFVQMYNFLTIFIFLKIF